MRTQGEDTSLKGGNDIFKEDIRNSKVLENDLLGLYLEDLSNCNKLLTKEEFDELHHIYQRGELAKTLHHNNADTNTEELAIVIKQGQDAFNQMFLRNAGLVISIAKALILNLTNDYSLMDLIEEGNVGLSKSIRCYDPDRGFSITTYATWKIRHEITRYIQNNPVPMRIPVGTLKQLMVVKRTLRDLHLNYEDGLSQKEFVKIAHLTGLKERRVKHLIALLERRMVSLNLLATASYDDQGTPVEELVDIGDKTPEDIVVNRLNTQILREELLNLETDLQNVIALRYGFFDGCRYKLSVIADMMGITRPEARAMQARALYKLRRAAFKFKIDGVL